MLNCISSVTSIVYFTCEVVVSDFVCGKRVVTVDSNKPSFDFSTHMDIRFISNSEKINQIKLVAARFCLIHIKPRT